MSTIEAGFSKKRSQYTPRACNGCRRRRCKCDGVHPTCGVCRLYGHECTWGAESKARRPPTKQLIESLRVNVKVLEDQVATLKAVTQNTGRTPSAALFPAQFRSPLSPWSTHQSQAFPTAGLAGATQFLSNDIYQYIFNVDHFIPLAEQPEIVQRSLLCDWDRHLPALGEVQLSRLEHDLVLDRYFRYSASWLMTIIPHLFLHDMLHSLAHTSNHEPAPPTLCYSPLLHCSILTLALSYSDNPLINQRATREKLASHAKVILNRELGHPTLSLIQALVVLSEYHCGIGEREEGYMYMGMSIRTARAMGLGEHVRHEGTVDLQAIVYNWSYWSVFSQDKIMALEYGRDRDLREPQHYVELPSICPEIDWSLWPYPAFDPASGSNQDSHLTQVFLESCKLMLVASYIVRETHSKVSGNLTLDNSAAVDANSKLDAWINNLPAELLISDSSFEAPFPHIIMMNMSYWWLLIRLHKPFSDAICSSVSPEQVLSAFGTQSVELCDRAAWKIIQLANLFRLSHGLRFFPRNMIQAICAAGAVSLRQGASIQGNLYAGRYEAQNCVRECITALRAVAETWQCAEQAASQLEVLLQQQTDALISEPTGYYTHALPIGYQPDSVAPASWLTTPNSGSTYAPQENLADTDTLQAFQQPMFQQDWEQGYGEPDPGPMASYPRRYPFDNDSQVEYYHGQYA